MDDLISRQAAIDALERMRNFYSMDDCPNIYAEYKRIIDEINNLPSAQPEQSDTLEFWRKRADYYSHMCINLISEMGRGVKINSMKISENGIEFIKEQPSAQSNLQPTCNQLATDCISRQEAIEAMTDERIVTNMDTVYDSELHRYKRATHRILASLPSAQPTLYGYKVEHLAMIARVMEKEGVSPEKAVETFQDIGAVVQMIVDEQKQIIRKAVEEWI